jgi:hypothetical protein
MQPEPLVDEKQIKDHYKDHSKLYNSVYSVDFIAKGGEAIVYRLEHADLEELVVKCSLFN